VARLVYSVICSLDGFIADEEGSFDWAAPDDEVHAFVNDLARPVGTHLYGRRLYEVMVAWETVPDDGSLPPVEEDFAAIWRDADKIVYSRTLDSVSSARTTIERDFDPAAVRRLKEAADRDLLIGGPDLASVALRSGLVDDVQLLVFPVLVGGGNPAWPAGLRTRLRLRDERRFGNGAAYLRYDVGEPL
jgi:dihydrofolate reductase